MPFFAGVGAGLATGIWLAPEDGQPKRERKVADGSAEAAKHGTENVSDAGDGTLDIASNLIGSAPKSDVDGATTNTAKAATEFIRTSKGVEHVLREQLENVAKRLQQA